MILPTSLPVSLDELSVLEKALADCASHPHTVMVRDLHRRVVAAQNKILAQASDAELRRQVDKGHSNPSATAAMNERRRRYTAQLRIG